jgi:hypothetical protein
MTSPLDGVCCACLPQEALAALAEVRSRPDVEAALLDGRAWVRWTAGDEDVLRCVLPVPGAELYACRDGLWYRPGRRLPSFDVPALTGALPLHRVLTPAPFIPERPAAAPLRPEPLRLVRDDRPRPATALVCDAVALAGWADSAPNAALAALRGARWGRLVLVLGRRLPSPAGAERFWGHRVLTPLGFRSEPDWAESALCQAMRLEPEEIVWLREGRVVVVPGEALRPLSRASLRLARREGPP